MNVPPSRFVLDACNLQERERSREVGKGQGGRLLYDVKERAANSGLGGGPKLALESVFSCFT